MRSVKATLVLASIVFGILQHLDSRFLDAAIVIAILFPFLTIALTEWHLRLKRERSALAAPVSLVRDFVLPTFCAFVLLVHIIGMRPSSTAVRLLQTLNWLFVIHAALALLKALVFGKAREGSWQSRVPQIFIGMARGLIVLICLGTLLSTVWGQDVGQIVAALGVGSLVLGLALQEPLGNLFNGLMLMAERPISIGDWIEVDKTQGVVTESNWRSIHLRNSDGDMIVLPNSMMAKASFTNFSRPNLIHSETLVLEFSSDDAPNKVKPMLLECASQTKGVLTDPPPKVRLSAFTSSGIEYKVKLRIEDFSRCKDVLDEFRTVVWYAARRAGLTMPYHTERHIVSAEAPAAAPRRLQSATESLRVFPFLGLTESQISAAINGGTIQYYAAGEAVVRRSQAVSALQLIISGRAVLTGTDAGGREVVVGNLEPGDFFGEDSLFSTVPSDVSVTALEDLQLLTLGRDSVHALSAETPDFFRQIGDVMEERGKALRRAGAVRRSA